MAETPRKDTVRASDRWKPVGWQGIATRAPVGWNLVAYSGDHDSGSFRLDNGALQPDQLVGMEVRWNTVGPKLKAEKIDERLKNFLASIEKGARKEKTASDTSSKSADAGDGRSIQRDFKWKADRKGVGRIWHCAVCGRIVITQVVGGLKENLDPLAVVSLREMRCHEGDWETWSFYDLKTAVPSKFRLRGEPQLLNVYIRLVLQKARSAETLLIEQWSVADMQRRGADLLAWFAGKGGPGASSMGDSREIEINGHAAHEFHGKLHGAKYLITSYIPQLLRLKKPAPWYRGVLWECPESNKIHLVQHYGPVQQDDTVDEITRRTSCH